MTDGSSHGNASAESSTDVSAPTEHDRLYIRITLVIQSLMALGLAGALWRRDWENVFLTTIVIALTLLPSFVFKRYRIYIPPEFQLISAAFIFLSLYLGSARDFYYRFWWWDMVLHTGSGFLLGIVGWISIFLLNRTNRIPQGMRPEFLCFFAVTFAVFIGVIWEIFEFVVDRTWPAINMQSNETGVVDTMHDLIVDTLGAVVVALMGLAYARSGKYSFVVHAVRKFTSANISPNQNSKPTDT